MIPVKRLHHVISGITQVVASGISGVMAIYHSMHCTPVEPAHVIVFIAVGATGLHTLMEGFKRE